MICTGCDHRGADVRTARHVTSLAFPELSYAASSDTTSLHMHFRKGSCRRAIRVISVGGGVACGNAS
jgi:hypothetical protein